MEAVRDRFGDEVVFFVVYTREPHPGIGGRGQTRTFEEKCQFAKDCREDLRDDRTYLVDSLDATVQRTYGGLPNNSYVIDKLGRVAYKEAWSHPKNLGRVLERLTVSNREAPSDDKRWY
ncbi:MAG: hypothetical protein HY720_08660 [Planctomycetes bacterium]|nr:hypothetical protein [Planctomycetota bacterium]